MRKILAVVFTVVFLFIMSAGQASAACEANRCSDESIDTDLAAGHYAQIRLLPVFGQRFNMSISGTWTGTVNLDRSFDGSTWVVVDTWTDENAEQVVNDPESHVYYRLGMANGAYATGTCEVRLSR